MYPNIQKSLKFLTNYWNKWNCFCPWTVYKKRVCEVLWYNVAMKMIIFFHMVLRKIRVRKYFLNINIKHNFDYLMLTSFVFRIYNTPMYKLSRGFEFTLNTKILIELFLNFHNMTRTDYKTLINALNYRFKLSIFNSNQFNCITWMDEYV